MKKILVAIADGVEEIEAVSVIDILRRAGAQLTVAAQGVMNVVASRNLKIKADKLLSNCVNERYDLIVVPGGTTGAENLRDSRELIALLKEQKKTGRLFAAICAAPVVVLKPHGLINDVEATCYPTLHAQLPRNKHAMQRVVVDKNCVTSQGIGTAIEFALTLVELLFGSQKVAEISKQLLVEYPSSQSSLL